MQPSSTVAHNQSQSFPHRAFAPISGCGEWLKEKHIERVIQRVIPSIGMDDFAVQLMPYPDNPTKIKSCIVAFASKAHFDALLAQQPSAVRPALPPLFFCNNLRRCCPFNRVSTP